METQGGLGVGGGAGGWMALWHLCMATESPRGGVRRARLMAGQGVAVIRDRFQTEKAPPHACAAQPRLQRLRPLPWSEWTRPT